jgi:hypothetical protein
VKKGRRKKETAVQNEQPTAKPEVFASMQIFCDSFQLRAIYNTSFYSNIFNNFQVKAVKAGRKKKEISVHKEEPYVGPEVKASLLPVFRIRDPVPFDPWIRGGGGWEKKSRSGSRIRYEHPGSYFREL